MATKAKEETKTETKPASSDEVTEPMATTPASDVCVVDDGTPHMGRAVNGKVCSAHAMNYKANGTRR